MISATELRKGLRILIDGEPFVVVDFSHVKMGRGRPHTKAKVKHLITGAVQEKTCLSNEMFDLPDLENRKMQYQYNDADGYHFMDAVSYDQVALSVDSLGDVRWYLRENDEYQVLFFEGRPISLDLPASIVLKVIHAEPAVKGDSVTNIQKTVTLETGLEIKVPLFIKEGDFVKVDTRTGLYLERSN
jgi:elongation factor P